jgi:hypothetical protein
MVSPSPARLIRPPQICDFAAADKRRHEYVQAVFAHRRLAGKGGFHLVERATLSGLHRIGLHGDPEAAIMIDDGAGRNLISIDFWHLRRWRQKSTEEIIQCLEPRVGNQEALTVKPDGTVVQGNTRTKVLEERGVDVNSLPRAPFDDSIDMFLPQIRTPGGGGGSLKDKK